MNNNKLLKFIIAVMLAVMAISIISAYRIGKSIKEPSKTEIIDSLCFEIEKLELSLDKKAESVVITKDSIITEIQKKYVKIYERIDTLPADSQVVVLSRFLSETDSAAK